MTPGLLFQYILYAGLALFILVLIAAQFLD